MAGSTKPYSAASSTAYLVKTDADDNESWSKHLEEAIAMVEIPGNRLTSPIYKLYRKPNPLAGSFKNFLKEILSLIWLSSLESEGIRNHF